VAAIENVSNQIACPLKNDAAMDIHSEFKNILPQVREPKTSGEVSGFTSALKFLNGLDDLSPPGQG